MWSPTFYLTLKGNSKSDGLDLGREVYHSLQIFSTNQKIEARSDRKDIQIDNYSLNSKFIILPIK